MSDRLKKSNYNIIISLDEARKNGEIVSISNSELIRTLFRFKNHNFDQKELDNLLITRKKIKKAENTEENRKKIEILTEKIEKTLFLEDLVSIQFKHKAHYLAILKRNGFYINHTRYVPFMATAGMIRRNTAMFINNNIKHQIMDILENGRKEDVPMVAAKFGAYFSLYCSSTLPVSFPRFAIVPDKEIQTVRKVDFVRYKGIDEDDEVTETDYPLTLNAFDGQGLISPALAKKWSDELELDYTFSAAIIRAPFLKGLIAVFDIESFSQNIAKKYEFKDIYGNTRDIRDVDLIISESMFKLWNCYDSTEDYIEKCKKNQLGFSIAKVNPKKENSYSRTSYQFLQILNFHETDIAEFCQPTLDWIRSISGGDANKMLLYATGENNFEPKDFRKMDASVKAIFINPAMARDKYVQNKFIKSIEKKKRESYIGNILVNANYQFMISDPFYQACSIFNLDRQPLLKEGEHYSEYWLKKGITRVGAIRSPIVHHSEFNILYLQSSPAVKKWYSHIHSGIIFPASGIGMDCAIHGGADFDGDLICTINDTTMINAKKYGIPIVYESQKAEKVIVDSRDDKKQVEAQLNGYNSKVGYATNISSSIYTLLEEFPIFSKERQVLLNRLKIGRVIQGEIIDGVKGLKVPPFRNHWTKRKKITPDMSKEEIEKTDFNNRIVCKIRPAFFRFLYPHYMALYNREIKRYNIYSHIIHNKPVEEILKNKKPSDEERELALSYRRNSFFLDNSSVVNRVSDFMRKHIALIDKTANIKKEEFDYTILTDMGREHNPYFLDKMRGYLKEYIAFKRGMHLDENSSFETLDAFIAYLRKRAFSEISSDETELVDYAVGVTYGENDKMVEFPWRLFPDGIILNIIKNSPDYISFPVQDDNGDVEYLWNKYTFTKIPLSEIYET